METENSVNALIPFKEKMKELYKLEETATNKFNRMCFQMMNENFRKHELMILKLVKGYAKVK
jgi:hypothetical protein